MSLQDVLKQAGFKPEASTDGEWQPYTGTYLCEFRSVRAEFDEKNNSDFIQLELDIVEHLAGDPKRDSKYPAFKKRYYVSFSEPTEDHIENAKEISSIVFTGTGLELDFSSKEAFSNSAIPVIGQKVYIRAWGFAFEKDRQGNVIPEDQRKAVQFFSAQKKSVAEKKRSAASLPF